MTSRRSDLWVQKAKNKIEQQGRFNPIVSVLASNWLLLSSRGEETIITSLKYSFLVTCTRQSISYLKKNIHFVVFRIYCKTNIIRNFPLSISTMSIFYIWHYTWCSWISESQMIKKYMYQCLVSLFYTRSCVFFFLQRPFKSEICWYLIFLCQLFCCFI